MKSEHPTQPGTSEQIVAMDLEAIVCKRKDSPIQSHGEAIALLDQGEEFTLQPIRGGEELLPSQVGASIATTVFAQQQFRNLA